MLKHRGGNILIGINDDKTVNGIESDINSFNLTKDEEVSKSFIRNNYKYFRVGITSI